MKIIYLANIRIPTEKAHGYQICKMCEEFAGLGAEVELWVPARDNQIKEDPLTFYGLKNNFKIRIIKNFDFFIYYEYLGKLSFWLQSCSFALKLFFIRADKAAVIYTRNPEISWIFNLRGYRTVFEAHNWPRKDLLFKFLAKSSGKIITITSGLREKFLKNNCRENNLLVAPDGVDLEKFDINIDKPEAKKKLNLPLDKKIALYSGSLYLYDWKGVDVFLDAAKILAGDCLAVLVGGNEAEVAKIKNEYQADNLLLTGHQPRQLIPYYLKAADVLVMPNKSGDKMSEKYTSPLKLFEYMASGRPLAASDLPSAREILNEKNCLFFRPNDAKDLAEKIKSLLSDQALANKIAAQAQLDAKKYAWRERAKSIIDFINL